jgi:pyruvate dehydrogenase (quinone)
MANVSDYIISRLIEYGVNRVYAYPGDGINGVMGALSRREDEIDFIQVRHEEMAAFMACGHAKFTGTIGVCISTSGPGAIHLLNGLYDARMDNQPVLALVGQQARTSLGGDYQQEVDLVNLFKDVCNYVQLATVPGQLRHLLDRAVRIALAEKAVTAIILPNDLQEIGEVKLPKREHGHLHSGFGTISTNIMPVNDDVRRAAEILNSGKKVAILVGAGALHAADEVAIVANILGAGVAKALLGKAVLPDDLPYVTGSIGLLGTAPSQYMMEKCDTLLMIGSNFPYSEFLPHEGQAKGVQIDIKPRHLGIRYPMDINLWGDSRLTLQQLIPLLQRKEDRGWLNDIQKEIADWWKTLEARAFEDANPINPQRVFWELSPKLPEDCIICTDTGSITGWYARDLKIRKGMMGTISGSLASMGCAMPYAMAAKSNFPSKPVLAIVGDGSMQMNGINTLITVAKYWKRWENPQLVVIVIKNNDLNMVTWEQRAFEGNPKFEASQNLPNFQYAHYAQSLGLSGIEVNHPDEISGALDNAFMAQRPVVLDISTDPNVPILPPHISLQEARNYLSAIMKGDVNSIGMIKQTFKDMIDSYIK